MSEETYENYRSRSIHHEYERIKRELCNGTLFGEPVDVDNQEELVVAAYHLGRQEDWHVSRKDLK